MAIKAVVFDFNGTLVDDLLPQKKAWKQVYEECELKESDLKRISGHNGTFNLDGLRKLFPEKEIEELRRISQRKEEIYRGLSREANLKLRQGVLEVFDWLKTHGIPFTIASASIPENIDFFCDFYGIGNYLKPDEIIYDDESFQDKSGMYLEAANKLNAAPDELLIIEDSYAGVSGAIKAGAENIFVIRNEDSAGLEKTEQPVDLRFFEGFEQAFPALKEVFKQ